MGLTCSQVPRGTSKLILGLVSSQSAKQKLVARLCPGQAETRPEPSSAQRRPEKHRFCLLVPGAGDDSSKVAIITTVTIFWAHTWAMCVADLII